MISRPALALPLALACGMVSAQTLRSLQTPIDLSLGVGSSKVEAMQSILEATPRLELDFSDRSSLVLSARLRVDLNEELEPGKPPRDGYAPASRPATLGDAGTVDLRDVYLEQRFDGGLLRLGKQQVVWGRLDGLKVLDVVNPQSFREFILDDFGESRISQWSAYLDVFAGAWRVEAAVVPDFTGHEIPKPGAWFELRAPRFRFGAEPGAPGQPQLTDNDRNAFDDAALGVRLSRPLGRVDVSALAYTGNDHEPLGRLVGTEDGIALERFYERRDVFGLSAATAFGPVALRAETSWQPDRVFNTRDARGLATAAANQVAGGVAADLDGPLGTLVNLQFLWDEVLDPPPGLIRPERDRVVTLFLRRNFGYETTRLEGRWYHSLDDGDELFRASLEHDLGGDTTLYVSGDFFAGTKRGLFGQFSGRDRVVFGIQHTF